MDKKSIAKAFDSAANSYNQAAVIQNEIADRMLERLELFKLQPLRVLDLGCGTGAHTYRIAKYYKQAHVYAIDLSFEMLTQIRKKGLFSKGIPRLCADMECLPVQDSSFDLIFANQVIHWSGEFQILFNELMRVLKPQGLLLFSSLGPDTMKELKAAWEPVESRPHILAFPDMHDIGDALQQAGFVQTVVDMEYITLTYDNISKLVEELRHQGVQNRHPERQRGLTTPKKWAQFVRNYQGFETTDGRLPVTYEVVYGQAWCPHTKPRSSVNDNNEVLIPISRIERLKS